MSHGTLRANVITARCSRGITWTRGLTATGCGRTGRTPSRPRARARWKIAAGRRVMNVGSVRPWAPRSRSARPGSVSAGGGCFPWLAGGSVPVSASPVSASTASASTASASTASASTGPAPTRPAVQHLVVRYAKRGKMRFASHRDVARAFERGVRRAGLPIAYSAGFTPHPKISYAGGVPTGVASEAEYLSLALTSRQAAMHVGERLNAALPDGIEVIDVTEDADSPRADSSALGRLEASRWRVVLPGVEPAAAQRAVAGFLALSQAPVERLTDKGVRCLDARAAVVTLDVLGPADPHGGSRASVTGVQDCAILRMVVLNTAPAVRPDDVLTALREQHGLVPSSPPITTRLAQGSLALLAGASAL